MDWIALPKAVMLYNKKCRQQRLTEPTKKCFSHGQGQYNTVATQNRSLAYKLIGKPANTLKYKALVFNYSINKVSTRANEYRLATESNRKFCLVSDSLCPICLIGHKIHKNQTKEQIFGGECKGTHWAVNNARDIIRDTLNKWELQDRTIWHIEDSINQETDKVDTQVHSLQNHEKAVGLIGLWTNPTIKYIKNKLKDDLNIQDQKALLMVYQLMYIQLDMSIYITLSLDGNRYGLKMP